MVVVTDTETGREVDQGDLVNEDDRSFSVYSWEFDSTVQYDNIYHTYRHENRG